MDQIQNKLTTSAEINIGFIHGWGMNSGAFTQLIKAVWHELEMRSNTPSPRFDLHTISLPGHGEQHDHIPEPFDLAGISTAIAPQIRPNTILIGWSLGGLVAQYLACIQHPHVVALMTIASTPKFQMANDWPGIKPEILQLFMSQLAQNHHKTLSRFLAIQMMGVKNAKQLIKEITQAIDVHPAPNVAALVNGLKILQEADIRQDIQHITIPTLRTYGRLDSLVPHSAITHIQALHPNSQHLIFKHASHAPFLTDAAEFSKHLVDFIRQFSVPTN